jgi:hypothetical protein
MGELPGSRRLRKLGMRAFAITTGKVVSLNVELSKRALNTLRRRTLSAKLTADVRNPGAKPRTATTGVKLLRPKSAR